MAQGGVPRRDYFTLDKYAWWIVSTKASSFKSASRVAFRSSRVRGTALPPALLADGPGAAPLPPDVDAAPAATLANKLCTEMDVPGTGVLPAPGVWAGTTPAAGTWGEEDVARPPLSDLPPPLPLLGGAGASGAVAGVVMGAGAAAAEANSSSTDTFLPVEGGTGAGWGPLALSA